MNTTSDVSEVQNENMTSLTEQTGKRGITFSDAERRIRSDWFKALIIFFLGSVAVDLGFYLQDTESNDLRDCLFGITGTVIQCALLFFFAYLRYGTKLLAVFVFVSPVPMILAFMQAFREFKSLGLSPNEVFRLIEVMPVEYFLFFSVISAFILFYGYFLVISKRLYDLNRVIKKRNG